jgi:hypothetical protein
MAASGGPKTTFGFDPRSIPGCALWLDAADRGSLTLVGSNVTQWNDKSGNGYSPTATSVYPTYSAASNCITWNGTSNTQLTFPAGISNVVVGTSFSIFIVEQRTTGSENFILRGTGTSTNTNLLIGYLNATTRRFAFYGNDHDSTVSTYASGEPKSLGYYQYSKPGRAIYGNGKLGSSDGNTNDLASWAGAMIGGGTMVNWAPYSGKVFEILVYKPSLASVQRQQVEGYLAWKWGIAARKTSVATFVPTSITGCQVWLDGADTSTLTLSGSNVAQWTDKSGKGYNATTLTNNGATRPVYNSNTKGLQFVSSNSNALALAQGFGDTVANNTSSFFFVAQRTIASGEQQILSGGYAGTNNLLIGFNNNTAQIGVYAGGVLANTIPTYSAPDPIRVYASAVTGPSNFLQAVDGTVIGTGQTSSYNGNTLSIVTSYPNPELGRRYGQEAGNVRYHNFNLFEMIVYVPAITTIQRQTVENYLISKWKIQLSTTLPFAHPFYSIRPYQRAFQPTDIPGCALWLDGSDAGTLTFSSGSNLATIKDKSHNGHTATAFSNSVATPAHSSGAIVSGTREKGSVTLLAGNGMQIPSFSMTPAMTVFYVSYANGATSVPTIEWSADATANPGFLLSTRSGSNFILNAGVTYSNFLMTTFFANTGSIPDRSGPSLVGGNNSGWGAVVQAGQALNPINFGNNLGYQPAGAYNYSALTTGFVYSASVGTIQFQGTTDDGLVIRFNGVDVLNQYQQQGATTYYSGSLVLPAGYTPIRITWYDTGGGGQYQVSFSINGAAYTNNGTGVFYRLSTATY